MKLIEVVEAQIEKLREAWLSPAEIAAVAKALEAAIAEYRRPMLLHDVDGWGRRFHPKSGIEYFTSGVEVMPIVDLFIVTVMDSDGDTATADETPTAGQLEVLREVFDH